MLLDGPVASQLDFLDAPSWIHRPLQLDKYPTCLCLDKILGFFFGISRFPVFAVVGSKKFSLRTIRNLCGYLAYEK